MEKRNAVRIKNGNKEVVVIRERRNRNLGTRIIVDKKKNKDKYKCRRACQELTS